MLPPTLVILAIGHSALQISGTEKSYLKLCPLCSDENDLQCEKVHLIVRLQWIFTSQMFSFFLPFWWEYTVTYIKYIVIAQQAPDVNITSDWRAGPQRRRDVVFWLKMKIGLTTEPNVILTSEPNVRLMSEPNVRLMSEPNVRLMSEPNVRLTSEPNVRLTSISNVGQTLYFG